MTAGREASGRPGPFRFLGGLGSGLRGRVARARELAGRLEAARHGRLLLPARRVRSRLLELSGAESLLLECREGELRLQAEWPDGRRCRLALREPQAIFVPGGAKECSFRLVLVAAGDREGAERLVGALAGLLAAAAWPWLARAEGLAGGLVERDGERWRVDLRSAPPVRELLARGGQPVLEVVGLEAVRFEARGIWVQLASPLLRR